MILIIVVCNVIRSTSVAGKYATFAPKHILKLKRTKITIKEVYSELMGINWLL